jgi:hypothetical protein
MTNDQNHARWFVVRFDPPLRSGIGNVLWRLKSLGLILPCIEVVGKKTPVLIAPLSYLEQLCHYATSGKKWVALDSRIDSTPWSRYQLHGLGLCSPWLVATLPL